MSLGHGDDISTGKLMEDLLAAFASSVTTPLTPNTCRNDGGA